jgi:hypothetical protein
VGLYSSYRFDLPTGAAIVCVLGACLLICMMIAGLRRRPADESDDPIPHLHGNKTTPPR